MADGGQLPPDILARYCESIRTFEKAFCRIPETERALMLARILEHCESARTYKWPDPESRDRDREARKNARSAASSARKLAAYLRRYPSTVAPVVRAQIETGVYLRLDETTPRGASDVAWRQQMAAEGSGGDLVAFSPSQPLLLSKLVDAVATGVDVGLVAGPMLHNFKHGPLIFSASVQRRGSMPKPPTCLAIFLSTLFRRYDLYGTLRFQTGEQIPADGDAQWPLVSLLVTEALGVTDNPTPSAQKVIKRDPNLGITSYS